MLTYDVPLVPGPTRVPQSVREAYLTDYGSADLEPEYTRLYWDVQEQLRPILGTENRIAIMTGEGMIALWGALKSCLGPETGSSPSAPASSDTVPGRWRPLSAPTFAGSSSATTR